MTPARRPTRPTGTGRRRLDRALRAAHARRRARHRAARPRERAPLRHRAAGVRDQPRPVPHPVPALRAGVDQRAGRAVDEEAQPRRAAVRDLLRAQPADAAGGAARRAGARAAPARARPTTPSCSGRPCRRASSPRSTATATCATAAWRRSSWRSTARRCCRRWSGWRRRTSAAPHAGARPGAHGAHRSSASPSSRRASPRAGRARPRSAPWSTSAWPGRASTSAPSTMLRQIRAENHGLTLQAFKQLLREQYFSLVLDREAALAAIPKMLPADAAGRKAMLDVCTAPSRPPAADRRTRAAAGADRGAVRRRRCGELPAKVPRRIAASARRSLPRSQRQGAVGAEVTRLRRAAPVDRASACNVRPMRGA